MRARRATPRAIAGVAASLLVAGLPILSHAQPPATTAVGVLPVQERVYMLVVNGHNSAVQTGADGILVVDPPAPTDAPRVATAIRTLSDRSVHTIINTDFHDTHTSGNDALVAALTGGPGQAVRVMAHTAVLSRLIAQAETRREPVTGFRLNQVITVPINNTYDTPARDFYLNGESIVLYHEPAAHTDGDTVVHFRRSDVLAVGDLFTPERYPVIDLGSGGSVQGLIDALNHILTLTVPARFQEGGTYVIPGRGRLCDEADVVEYRDMLTIVRDRVQDLVARKLTLAQVQAARPSRDYDPDYAFDPADVSGDQFVEAIYRSLAR
jgi:cyclase